MQAGAVQAGSRLECVSSLRAQGDLGNLLTTYMLLSTPIGEPAAERGIRGG